jgi:hypothetical protein
MDRKGKADPYVVLSCGKGKEQRSKVMPKTLSPVWDDAAFKFSAVESDELVVSTAHLFICIARADSTICERAVLTSARLFICILQSTHSTVFLLCDRVLHRAGDDVRQRQGHEGRAYG